MILYKNTKTIACATDCGTDFFDIMAEELQKDRLEPYVFIIFLKYALRTLIDLIKGFTQKSQNQMISFRNYNRQRLLI